MLASLSFTAVNAQNLLNQDPDFEETGTDNALNWRWYTGAYNSTTGTTTRETSSAQNGSAYAKAVTTAINATPQYYYFGMSNYQTLNTALEAGKTYVISFYYQNTAGHSFQVGVQDNNGNAPYDFFKTINTEATSWTLGTYEFTATADLIASTNDVRLKFQFGKDLGTTLIDNITLTAKEPPVPSANIVLNPSFETDNGGGGLFKNWFAQAETGSTITAPTTSPQDGSRYFRADVTTAGSGAWNVQAFTDNFAVVPGHNYLVSFWYKSDKSIRLVMQGSTYYNQTDIPASSTPGTWVKYEKILNYASTETDIAMSLKFHLNVDNGFVEIDNVSVNDLSVLPVTLTSYTAKPTLSDVVLSWSTSSENNSDYYQVLRAGDDKVFAPITTQPAMNKAATYSFKDKAPLKGNNYYQLLQYDKDGRVNDLGTQVAFFNLNTDNEISIYPNPASDWVNIDLGNYSGKTAEITISDLSGRVVLSKTISRQGGIDGIRLPTGLTPGIYTLTVKGDGLNKSSRLLIK